MISKFNLKCQRYLGTVKSIYKGYYIDQLSDSDNIIFRGGSYKTNYIMSTYGITDYEYDSICINGRLNHDHSTLFCRRFPREVKMINNHRYVNQISEYEDRSFSSYDKDNYLKVNYNLTFSEYVDIIMFDRLSDIKYQTCYMDGCDKLVKLDYKEQPYKFCSSTCQSRFKMVEFNKRLWHDEMYEDFRERHTKLASKQFHDMNINSWRDPEYRKRTSEFLSRVCSNTQKKLMESDPESYSKHRIHNSLKLSYQTELNRSGKDEIRYIYLGDIDDLTFKIGITSDIQDRNSRLGYNLTILKEGPNYKMAYLEYLVKLLFEDLDFNYINGTTEVFKSSRKESIITFINNFNFDEWKFRSDLKLEVSDGK